LGDNLIRKYKTELLLESCIPAIELAYSSIENIAGAAMSREVRESLRSARQWMVATRNVGAIFKSKPYVNISEALYLPYDANAWYLHELGVAPLTAYSRPGHYRIFCEAAKLKIIFEEMEKLYGGDFSFQVGKLLNNWDVKNFCRKCETIK
ncbi:MAG: hypothetical protein HQ579_06960, partial [Candidatus Omnitrophica bacterium]|nr:hypothetical protein [Candidatus Omnitrophota bacterium]